MARSATIDFISGRTHDSPAATNGEQTNGTAKPESNGENGEKAAEEK